MTASGHPPTGRNAISIGSSRCAPVTTPPIAVTIAIIDADPYRWGLGRLSAHYAAPTVRSAAGFAAAAPDTLQVQGRSVRSPGRLTESLTESIAPIRPGTARPSAPAHRATVSRRLADGTVRRPAQRRREGPAVRTPTWAQSLSDGIQPAYDIARSRNASRISSRGRRSSASAVSAPTVSW